MGSAQDRGAVHGNRVVSGQRRIIRRPRLTRILDESNARLLTLVAPAGYGKTTLARQWLENKPHAWYQGGPASADVAALAACLADACALIVPNAGERMQARLRATNSPEEDVEPLAELLAEDLTEWPLDAWLSIDDYQHAIGSASAERFLDVICNTSRLRCIIATRERPSWVSARRLLYGEVHELSRATLAMDQDEVAEILSATSRHATGLLALADGWPAVIGLAASSPKAALPEDVPERLYDFFAQELLTALPDRLQKDIEQLAAAPWIDRHLATVALDSSAEEALTRGEQIGILTREAGDRFAIHPLLRAFLVERLRARGENIDRLLQRLVRFYTADGDWDAAFSVVELSEEDGLLCGLLTTALPVLLASGRLRTLSSWLATAHGWQTRSSVLDLAAAEIAYREGDGIGARAITEHALGTSHPSDPLRGHLLLLAGKAALLLHDTEQAVTYMNAAQAERLTEEQAYEAAWGRFLAAARLEAADAHALLAELAAMSRRLPERRLRAMSGEWVLAVRTGSIHHLLQRFEALVRLAPRASDPVTRSAFLISRVHLLAVLGHYPDALAAIDALEAEAQEFRLEFAVPHISMAKALVHLGLRQFSQAASLIACTERVGVERSDIFVQMNSAALRGRLFLYQSSPADAVAHLAEHWPVLPERSLHAEYLGVRALALVANGSLDEALAQCEAIAGMSGGIEAAILRLAASAVIELRRGAADAPQAVRGFVESALRTGNHDGFLFACRVFQDLANSVGEHTDYHPRLAGVVRRANDSILARQWHLPLPPRTSADCLTPREREVYELIALGRTNKEIAAALFISEPTAKVHTLHILEKLGLRSRTEAALHASRTRQDYAAASTAEPNTQGF